MIVGGQKMQRVPEWGTEMREDLNYSKFDRCFRRRLSGFAVRQFADRPRPSEANNEAADNEGS